MSIRRVLTAFSSGVLQSRLRPSSWRKPQDFQKTRYNAICPVRQELSNRPSR